MPSQIPQKRAGLLVGRSGLAPLTFLSDTDAHNSYSRARSLDWNNILWSFGGKDIPEIHYFGQCDYLLHWSDCTMLLYCGRR